MISRKTLGRGASLCDLYDVRREVFCGESLLTSAPPEAAITSQDMPHMLYEYTDEQDYHTKFHKLGIEGDLKVSVLGGLVSLSGSGKYLNDESTSQKVVRGTLIYKITTKEDSINLNHNLLRPHVNPEQYSNPEATHVVCKIRWGANVFVTFEKKVQEHKKTKEIAGTLQATLMKCIPGVSSLGEISGKADPSLGEISGKADPSLGENSGKAGVEYSDKDTHEVNSFSIKVQGDVVPDDERAPRTVEEVKNLLSMIPQYVKKYNQGRGKPLEIELKPIQHPTSLAIKEDKLKIGMDLATIENVESEIDTIVQEKQILNDFIADVRDFSEHVSEDDLNKCSEYKKLVNTAESEFRGSVRRAILEIRQNGASTSILNDAIREYQENQHSSHKISDFMAGKSSLKNKMDFFQLLKEKAVEFLPKSKSIENFVIQHNNRDVYAFYYSDNQRNTPPWGHTLSVFLETIKESNELAKIADGTCGVEIASTSRSASSTTTTLDMPPKFLVVDQALHEGLHRPSVRIVQYCNGQLTCADVVNEKCSSVTQNIIRWTTISKYGRPPRNANVVRLICPLATILSTSQSKCSPERRVWVCRNCNQEMEYDLGNHFYCNCGGILVENCMFKCCDPHHGAKFRKFDSPEALKDWLPKVADPDCINIVLMGETGVGKTTFINALRNYWEYPTLKDAMDGGVKVLTPFKFMQGDTPVLVGEEDPQQEACTGDFEGKSSTRSCMSHYFILGKDRIRIIDTPGICDTEGFDRDEKNTEHILQYLTNVDQLHGICIFLRPDLTRLTLAFQFSITSLLTNLHKHAVNNIMFCYTFSRHTHFDHGYTHNVLKRFLHRMTQKQGHPILYDKLNTFFVDNECLEFLASIQPGEECKKIKLDACSNSWGKTRSEILRLIDTIKQIEPHVVAETLSVNDARKIITLLARPLAEIVSTITSNIAIQESHVDKINKTIDEEEQLRLCLWKTEEVLEVFPVEYPQTVCTAESCISVVKSLTIYPICHGDCHFASLVCNIVGSRALWLCKCMAWYGNCKSCGCSYHSHQNITYKTRRVQEKTENEIVKKQMEEKVSKKEIVKSALREIGEKIKELETVRNKMTIACVQFTAFLKANAITPFNDMIGEQLNDMIKKRRYMGENDVAEQLTQQYQEYEKEKQMYEANLAAARSYSALPVGSTTHTPLRPEDVPKVRAELEKLSLYGDSLAEQMKHSQECMAKATQYHKQSTYTVVRGSLYRFGLQSKSTVVNFISGFRNGSSFPGNDCDQRTVLTPCLPVRP